MKVALVHDWFVGGGAERVVEQLHKMYPEAPIYTSYCSPAWQKRLGNSQIITGYLQHWPFSKLRKFVGPLRALWFSHLNFDGFDLVISSSGAEAKGIKVKKPAIHVNYCHAPTHYYWERYNQYLTSPGFGFFDPLARLGLRFFAGPMRRWDKKAAQRPDYIIANSSYTKDQIKKYYGRDAEVIHPPVDVERYKSNGNQPRSGFVTAGRQTPYKKIDLAVTAANSIGAKLLVIGNGPQHSKLVRLAEPNVSFTQATDEQMINHFQEAEAFIFPGIDDFGIIAVEALAAGTPVIAYKAGGALDYIKDGQNGLFFDHSSADSLAKVMTKFEAKNFDHQAVAKSAGAFAPSNFKRQFEIFVKGVSGQWTKILPKLVYSLEIFPKLAFWASLNQFMIQ